MVKSKTTTAVPNELFSRKTEEYKRKIQEAYDEFFPDIEDAYAFHKEKNLNNENGQIKTLHLFKEIMENYYSILQIENGLDDKSFFETPFRVSETQFRDIENKKELVQCKMMVFCDKQNDIKNAFFNYDKEKSSKAEYPFFVYIDKILKFHMKKAAAKYKATEVKSGMVGDKDEEALGRAIIKFLNSHYSYLDYDRIPYDVLKEFIEFIKKNGGEEYGFAQVKDAYVAARTKSISIDVLREKEDEEFINGSEATKKEQKENQNKNEKETVDLEETVANEDVSDDDTSVLITENTFAFDAELRNTQVKSLFENCEAEFKKITASKQRVVSAAFTAELIRRFIKSSRKLKNETYSITMRHSGKYVDEFLRLLKDEAQTYSFISEEMIKLYSQDEKYIQKNELSSYFGQTETYLSAKKGTYMQFERKLLHEDDEE